MKLLLAFIGLMSFGTMFVGTAMGILLVGFGFGAQVFAASSLIFIFCFIIDTLMKK